MDLLLPPEEEEEEKPGRFSHAEFRDAAQVLEETTVMRSRSCTALEVASQTPAHCYQ